jgi:hypothetical protein
LDLSEAVSVFASFARQYGAEWAVLRILSGRLQMTALPRLEEVCVPVTVWWPGLHAGDPPEGAAGRPDLRLDWMDECGPLAPLDLAGDLTGRLQRELFTPVRMAEAR